MQSQQVTIGINLIVALLLAVYWYITGCEQAEQQTVAPDQQAFVAPCTYQTA